MEQNETILENQDLKDEFLGKMKALSTLINSAESINLIEDRAKLLKASLLYDQALILWPDFLASQKQENAERVFVFAESLNGFTLIKTYLACPNYCRGVTITEINSSFRELRESLKKIRLEDFLN